MVAKRLNAESIKRAIPPNIFYHHVLGGNVQFNKNGWNIAGICPFHNDTHEGSFHINAATGAFKCFSCEAAGGDIIAFTMKLHGISFVDALGMLAKDWGLQ